MSEICEDTLKNYNTHKEGRCRFCNKVIVIRYKCKPKQFCNNICCCAFHNSKRERKTNIGPDYCLVCYKPQTEKQKQKGALYCSDRCRSKAWKENNKKHEKQNH